MNPTRRHLLLGTAAATLALPALASSRRTLAAMTDGPFYPPRAWREGGPLAGDWDADLTHVQRAGRVATAQGEHLGVQAVVTDTQGRLVDGTEVEIWQCDALAQYRHPRVPLAAGGFDTGFQGYGATRADRAGTLTLRTIKPVPYPGRTPHIHLKLRHATFGELTTQLFLAGDPGNTRDFLGRAVPADERAALELKLQPAPAESGLRWVAQHVLMVPG